jgi:hypothetical protein
VIPLTLTLTAPPPEEPSNSSFGKFFFGFLHFHLHLIGLFHQLGHAPRESLHDSSLSLWVLTNSFKNLLSCLNLRKLAQFGPEFVLRPIDSFYGSRLIADSAFEVSLATTESLKEYPSPQWESMNPCSLLRRSGSAICSLKKASLVGIPRWITLLINALKQEILDFGGKKTITGANRIHKQKPFFLRSGGLQVLFRPNCRGASAQKRPVMGFASAQSQPRVCML